MNDTLIAEQKVEGTRAFGVHSPVALHLTNNPLYLPQSTGLRALFNNFGIHSPSLALSLASSLLIRRATGRDIIIKVFASILHYELICLLFRSQIIHFLLPVEIRLKTVA